MMKIKIKKMNQKQKFPKILTAKSVEDEDEELVKIMRTTDIEKLLCRGPDIKEYLSLKPKPKLKSL